jgi:hypothetical protein
MGKIAVFFGCFIASVRANYVLKQASGERQMQVGEKG